MKTKQQVIEEAYGEHLEALKGRINLQNGVAFTEEKPIEIGFEPGKYLIVGTTPSGLYWTPACLLGISNNNGWHVINGPEDLPKVKGFYMVWWNSGRSDPKGRMWFDPDSNHWVENWLDWFSHWQPEAKPPLYGPSQKGGPQ